jgi:hypothetical protein
MGANRILVANSFRYVVVVGNRGKGEGYFVLLKATKNSVEKSSLPDIL